MAHRQDIVLGVLFALLGIIAAWMSSAYSGATGIYPMVLGMILLALGVLIVARAVRAVEPQARELTSAPSRLALTTGVLVVYIALIVPLGFYTASLLLMLLLPVVLGFRRPLYLSMTAMVFIAVLFVAFTLVLEKPLPAEVWSSARLGAE